MLNRSICTGSVTIGIIALFWRGRETLPTVYWNSSPTLAADAIDSTEAAASIGLAGSAASDAASRRARPPLRATGAGAAAGALRARPARLAVAAASAGAAVEKS